MSGIFLGLTIQGDFFFFLPLPTNYVSMSVSWDFYWSLLHPHCLPSVREGVKGIGARGGGGGPLLRVFCVDLRKGNEAEVNGKNTKLLNLEAPLNPKTLPSMVSKPLSHCFSPSALGSLPFF